METFFDQLALGFTLACMLGMMMVYLFCLISYTVPALIFTAAVGLMWLVGYLADKYL